MRAAGWPNCGAAPCNGPHGVRPPHAPIAHESGIPEVVENLIQLFESDLEGPDGRERALAILTLCVGGMVVGRAIEDPALADEFRDAALRQVLITAGWGEDQSG